jgi:hypothetical protein
MSRRPQEPLPLRQPASPADVPKTSGIDVSYSRRVAAVKRFVTRADLWRQIRSLRIRRFAPQGPRTHSPTKIRKVVRSTSEILLLRSHFSLNRTVALERREDLNSRTARRAAAYGGRQRRSLTSNPLCAFRRSCDLRKTPLARHFNKCTGPGRIVKIRTKTVALTPAAVRPPHRPRKSPSRRSTRRPGSWSRPACALDRNI